MCKAYQLYPACRARQHLQKAKSKTAWLFRLTATVASNI